MKFGIPVKYVTNVNQAIGIGKTFNKFVDSKVKIIVTPVCVLPSQGDIFLIVSSTNLPSDAQRLFGISCQLCDHATNQSSDWHQYQ